MKKLFLALVVCAGFCACSNDDVVVTSNPGDYSREAAAYLTVNIKDVNSGTRATDGGFAYGTSDEQDVNNAYFYFYDAQGNYMANGAVTGGVSGTGKTSVKETADTNIEWNSGTLVAVYGLYADQELPTQMLTILNKPTSVDLTNKSLSDALATLAGTPYGDSTNGFVMSTSVYEGTEGAVYTTALEATDFALEPIDIATDYPDDSGVDVYVERLAAKVGVNCSMITLYQGTYIYAASEKLLDNFAIALPELTGTNQYAIQLEGFDVDGVARDAYLVKNVDADWNLGSWTWNAAGNYRSYWAESPNYNVAQDYPTSSNGNTATEEATAGSWLNDYLRYVDLKSPVAIGNTTYCGENTNTVVTTDGQTTTGVIDAIDNNGLTNVIVKAKFGEYNPNYGTVTGVDLVEYHDEYYRAADFLDKCVTDVMNYDFTVVVDEIVEGLKTSAPELSGYLDDINNAIIKDAVYVSAAYDSHKVTSAPTSVSLFDGSMLSLYNIKDGYVDLFFNGAEQYYGENGVGTQVEPTLCGKYPADDIVYGGAKMSDYEFYFHVNYSALEAATRLGSTLLNLLYQVDGEYYLPLDNRFYITTQNSFTDDKTWNGDHIYTLRNYFLRAITVEADGIDKQFGTHYPNYFAGGEMYYHVPIEHLNTSNDETLLEGQYGVVRNHWYDITITSLEGLGRGIADENEVIVPLPEVEYYYLGADINILSWKMVQQSVGF